MTGEIPRAGSDSIFRTADVVGDAWSLLVLREAILHGVTRFGDFQSRLGIARETLSARLQQLVEGGLLARTASAGRLADYTLTQAGADFFMCLAAAQRWGRRWAGPVAAAEDAIHMACGKPFAAVFLCSACKEPLDARAVEAILRGKSVCKRAGTAKKRHRSPGLDLLERVRPSAIARTLKVVGDRWSSLVIQEAFFGTRRFDDFMAKLSIAPNILSQRLTRLVDLGMLSRRLYSHAPERYEYRLTEKGIDLYPLPLAMLEWGRRWLPKQPIEIVLKHRSCGKSFRPVLACHHCRQPASRSDVSVR